MSLPPVRVVETRKYPHPFASHELSSYLQGLTCIMLLHVRASPRHVADYLRGVAHNNEPQWYAVGLHGSRHLLLKRGRGEYMAVDYSSAVYEDANCTPDGIYVLLQWEGVVPDEAYEAALEAELNLVSGVLAEWLRTAEPVQV